MNFARLPSIITTAHVEENPLVRAAPSICSKFTQFVSPELKFAPIGHGFLRQNNHRREEKYDDPSSCSLRPHWPKKMPSPSRARHRTCHQGRDIINLASEQPDFKTTAAFIVEAAIKALRDGPIHGTPHQPWFTSPTREAVCRRTAFMN